MGLDPRAISPSALNLADQKISVLKMGDTDRLDLSYQDGISWFKMAIFLGHSYLLELLVALLRTSQSGLIYMQSI